MTVVRSPVRTVVRSPVRGVLGDAGGSAPPPDPGFDGLTFISLYGQSLSLGVDPDGSEIVSREAAKTITGATQANPVVVTSVAHGYSTGDTIYIAGVVGMTAINNKSFEIVVLSADTFSLYWHDGAVPSVTTVDGTAFVAYSSGGSAYRVEVDPVHFMFNGGVRPHYDDPSHANVNSQMFDDTMASLLPLNERMQRADSDYGETFASGMGAQITDPCIFAGTGRGAYKVSELDLSASTGFFHFSNTYAAALNARERATELTQSFRLGPMIFKQGEADAAAATAKATWKTSVNTLRADFEERLRHAVLDDIAPFQIIVDQQAYAGTGYGNIAVAAIELHREDAGIFCAGPTYWCEFTAVNDVHMIALTYRRYGEHLGRVVQSILDGDGWSPCHITNVVRSGTTITVTIHVPEGALVEDTTLVSTVANKGFTYTGATITAVTITDTGATDQTAVVEITIDASAGGNLRYAYNNGTADRIGPTLGPRGNLRDSSSLVAAHDGSNLYNWLCVDDWTVA